MSAGVAELDPRFLDHFRQPRNVGELPAATGTATVENPACGDLVRVALKIEGGRITALRFRCDGCSGSIAAMSVASELVRGRTLAEARALDATALDAALGGLPTLKRHGADLAADALAAAIRDHEGRDRDDQG